MKQVILLGASGSIGQQTIDILTTHPEDFSLVGASVGEQDDILLALISAFPSLKGVYLLDEVKAVQIRAEYPSLKVFTGKNGLNELVTTIAADLVVNALVGFVGLSPTLYALQSGKDVALANKEALVVGGELIKRQLQVGEAELYPIDSEHVALRKCLSANRKAAKKLWLTASGGSFRHLGRHQLANVTIEDALKHPSWSMGAKITIDSATMMNKGFEVIEAYYLFDFPLDDIGIIMHDESVVHSLVEYNDGSFLADLGPADMRIPIGYALYHGERNDRSPHKTLTIEQMSSLHFKTFDRDRYPAVTLAINALKAGGTMPTVLNAANEVAVNAFLNKRIPFLAIEDVIKWALDNHQNQLQPTLKDITRVHSQTVLDVNAMIERSY